MLSRRVLGRAVGLWGEVGGFVGGSGSRCSGSALGCRFSSRAGASGEKGGGEGKWSASGDSFRFMGTRFLPPLQTLRRGLGIVHDPIVNKGTGFTMAERERLRIRGLVPPRMLDMDTQVKKIYGIFKSWHTDLNKHVYLTSLQDRNETLFYKVLIEHVEEMAPIIYTPIVGQACQIFGDNFRRARGMYFSSQDKGEMGTMVHNWPHEKVSVVVITDGSRILGLGDLGANGMGIPIGKLSLYVAAGGIDPKKTLPVLLDCGTNNKQLLANPYYLGMQHPRLQGEAYYELVHELMEALHNRWPNALIQFEDFSTDHAAAILDRYRRDRLCFNDDIQGTGAVTLAGLLSAIRVQGEGARLRDQRIVVLGAGSAGIGVASTLRQAMLHEGLSDEEAGDCFWVLDDGGLLAKGREGVEEMAPQVRHFVRGLGSSGEGEEFGLRGGEGLEEVVAAVKPTVLLGLTGVPGLFTEGAVREMSKHVDRPIVFPLSNPTSSAECTAEQAYTWSQGRAVVASGSPFDPVEFDGKTLTPSQCNNMFIFPGVGLGALLAGARHISDDMFYAAAVALSECVPPEEIEQGKVFPRVRDIRAVSRDVATAVWKAAAHEGIATNMPPASNVEQHVEHMMWKPVYRNIINATY